MSDKSKINEPFSSRSSDDYISESESSDKNDALEAKNAPRPGVKKNRLVVDSSQWQRNKRKSMLAKGEKHLNSVKKIKEAQKIMNDCKCKFKCFERVTEEDRACILKKFNEIGDKILQDTYLSGLISVFPVSKG
ncbi:unnamed protein product [Psylliodes chrysocephalus]|uniref:Uncharacterized protein n=1 Tax=Psylliodes chrysocephalus TaxID=3402493 RepID=A0A9P0D3M2_9CUCU|nr:unnamed protein product [Psylliodes chrysocephala]